MLAGAKLPYVIHLLCPSPRNETLRAFLPETLNECPYPRGVGLLPCVIDVPYVLLIGNGAVGPPMEYHWVHCMNITLTVMYVKWIRDWQRTPTAARLAREAGKAVGLVASRSHWAAAIVPC